MKKILLLAFLSLNIFLHAQFQQTNGPTGISIRSIVQVNESLIGLTQNHNLLSYKSGVWQRIEINIYSHNIAAFNNRLYILGNDLYYYDFEKKEPVKLLTGTFNNFSIGDSTFFAVNNDTVYHTTDGLSWSSTFDSLRSKIIFAGDTVTQTLRNIQSIVKVDSTYILACTGDFSLTQKGIYVSHNYGKNWFEPEGIEDFANVNKIIKQDRRLFALSTNGIYLSNDKGNTWVLIEEGLTYEEKYKYIKDIIVSNGELYVLQDSPNTIFRLGNENTWQPLDITLDVEIIAPYVNSDLLVADRGNIYIYNTNNNSLESISVEEVASNSSITAINEETVIAVKTFSNDVFLTTNGGSEWKKRSSRIEKIAVAGSTLFFSNSNGVFSSEDFGRTKTNVNSNLPVDNIESVSVLGVDSNSAIYVGFSRLRRRTHLSPVWEAGGIYKSTDSGNSWVQASSGLPTQGGIKVPISKLITGDGILIIETVEGTYRSTNGGESWQLFENGFTEFSSPLFYGSINDSVFISTYTDGVLFTSRSMDSWKPATVGLNSMRNGYDYRFVKENRKLYLYDNIDKKFYKFDSNRWSSLNIDLPEEFVVNQFVSVEGKTYASINDGGVWSGSVQSITSVWTKQEIVKNYELLQNYPNPFNPETVIEYALPAEGFVKLKVYNMLGEKIETLVSRVQPSGSYSISFNGENLPSGIYFYTIETGKFRSTKKMVLVK